MTRTSTLSHRDVIILDHLNTISLLAVRLASQMATLRETFGLTMSTNIYKALSAPALYREVADTLRDHNIELPEFDQLPLATRDMFETKSIAIEHATQQACQALVELNLAFDLVLLQNEEDNLFEALSIIDGCRSAILKEILPTLCVLGAKYVRNSHQQ